MELKNKVAESGIITIDLEKYFPVEDIVEFDIKPYLLRGLILKEMEFRTSLKNIDWQEYKNKTVTLFCSSDAILPKWSYMLITQYLLPYTDKIYFGFPDEVEQHILLENINKTDINPFVEQRVVIKGCGNKKISDAAYIEISKRLLPYVKSLFFGEPCSTVPVYKKKN